MKSAENERKISGERPPFLTFHRALSCTFVAHFLFIDESGYDNGPSPYGVLGGVAIEDRDVWNLIKAMQDAELRHFGTRYSVGQAELKAKKLISAQVFRQAALSGEIAFPEGAELAKRCLERGAGAPPRSIAALTQAELEYVREVLEICSRFRCRAFASVVDKDSPSPGTDHLRKDYVYLFERFFYFLGDLGPDAFGVAVFDELEKIQSHLLASQMDAYFKRTMRGRQRAGRILPEPLFVHSDLTTGVQLADLVAYILSWGWRLRSMARLARPELAGFAAQICQLRHRAVREVAGNPLFTIWSFAFITGLGHVVSEIQRQSLVPLQSGVDIVQAIPKLADRDGSLYPSHGIGARRMPPHPALPEARGVYGFQGIETS